MPQNRAKASKPSPRSCRGAFTWPDRRQRGLAGDTQDGPHANSEVASDPADAGALGAGRDDRRHLVRVAILQPPPAELGPFGLGSAQTGHDALTDHRALELSKYPQHLKHGPAGWCRRIEALLMQEQVDALGVQFAEEVEQVDQRPT
jgi:hypothetical protein